MTVEVEIKDSRGWHQQHSLCNLRNVGTESNPDLIVEKQVNGSCKQNSTEYISFIAEKVPPGNYTVRVEVFDNRCETGTLWTKSGYCIWEHDTFGTESDDASVVSVSDGSSIWISVTVVIVIIHIGIIIWYFFIRSRKATTPVQTEYQPLRPRTNNVHVLLLYPSDCIDFMKTMSSFRKLLERFSNIEVHDCHTLDVLQDPLDWFRKVMNYSKLNIIIVANHCAFLQQERILSGDTENDCIYRNPTFLDSIFPYGLKQIMNDFSPDIYHKSHIIGFTGFSENEHMLKLPSSLRRYNLPEHLDKLVSALNLEYNQFGSFNDSWEYQSFLRDITTLRNFKLKYPDYLESLLNLK